MTFWTQIIYNRKLEKEHIVGPVTRSFVLFFSCVNKMNECIALTSSYLAVCHLKYIQYDHEDLLLMTDLHGTQRRDPARQEDSTLAAHS